jgi:hypothetical protein
LRLRGVAERFRVGKAARHARVCGGARVRETMPRQFSFREVARSTVNVDTVYKSEVTLTR